MVGPPFADPTAFGRPTGVRPTLVALLFAALGAAAMFWPGSLLPAGSGAADHTHNLGILRTMLRLEGLGLWALALLVWRFPTWLDSFGGDDVLETHAGAALGMLVAVHAVGVLLYLPPQQIFSADPLYTADHATHLYRAFGARALFRADGALDGFDPYVNAGTPWGMQPDTRGFEWFAVLLPFLGLASLGKVWVLVVEALVPLSLWGAARLCGLERRSTWWVVLLGLVYWHAGRPFLGHLRWNGDHAFLLACLGSLLATAVTVRYLDRTPRRRRRLLLLLWPVLAIGGFIHPLGLLLPFVPLALLLLWSASSVGRLERFALALVPLSILVLHAHWILPLIRQRTELPLPAANLRLHGLADLVPLLQQVGIVPLLSIVVLAVAGSFLLRRRQDLALVGLGGLAVTCAAIVVWGYALPGLRRFETARFLVPAMLALCVLAGPGAAALTAWLRPRLGASFVLLLLTGAATLPAFAAVLETRFFYVHRVHAILPADFHRLMGELQEAPGRNARLLFETTRRGWVSDNGSDGALEALVPLYTHRQVLGLSNPRLSRRARAMTFGRGQLASHPFATWTNERFADFLSCYDVGTVVAWSPEAQRFLSRFSDHLEAPRTLGDVQIFAVRNWKSRLQGLTDLSVGYGRIELRRIREDDIVLPIHWSEDLRATPEITLRPRTLPGAVAPLVELRPGDKTFVILHD